MSILLSSLPTLTLTALALLFPSPAPVPAAPEPPRAAVDTDPDPRVFATRLVARPVRQDLDGDGVKEEVWSFNGSVPGPEIRVRVGDVVRVRFRNKLPVASSIHWHGIELTNRADGTPVTQNEVPPGGRFRYEFQVTRPGVFWYHPHIRPSNQVWKGLYGPLIVTDDAESTLADAGVIPDRELTLTLADVTVCKTSGENDDATFPNDPSLPWAGGAAFPGSRISPTPRELCETPRDAFGEPGDEPLAAGAIPNVEPRGNCLRAGGVDCRVNPGQWVLTNGRRAAARAGSPGDPGALAATAAPISVGDGEGLRLRLINASLIRFYRLRLTDANGRQLRLYRIGGEGGLLNRVRFEGGRQQLFETNFDRGEILLGPSERADVVIVPRGAPGDVLTLWTRDFPNTGRGFAFTPTVPVLHLRIDPDRTPDSRFPIARRMPLRRDPLVDSPIENLRGRRPTAGLVDPSVVGAGTPGTAIPEIRFTNSSGPSIDGVVGSFDAAAVSHFRQVPYLASSRFARVGGLLELSVLNQTAAHHVFHLHGFSFQPVRLEFRNRVVYRFPYPEFMDSLDLPSEHRLVFKVRLDDRPLKPGLAGGGGAVGRWLLHCHLFPHAALGMISELVVLPPE